PGTDRGSNKSLNAEYIVLKNTSSQTKTITGYRLHDKANHRYVFPTTRLKPGKVIYVRTGKGTNNYQNRYWGLRFPPDRRGIDNEDRDAREAEEVRPGVP